MSRRNSTVAAVALALMLAIPAGPLAQDAFAQTAAQPTNDTRVQQPNEGGVNWPGAGYGVGALFANILYVPAKLVYAILGGLIGGGTYLVTAGNKQAADTVWRSSFGGDYVVTPQMLSGDQPINFSGPTDTPPEPAPSAASAAPAMNSANYGSVAPITPIPASNATTSSSHVRPLDHGAGPAGSSSGLPNSTIE
jgi:hypothetical protein